MYIYAHYWWTTTYIASQTIFSKLTIGVYVVEIFFWVSLSHKHIARYIRNTQSCVVFLSYVRILCNILDSSSSDSDSLFTGTTLTIGCVVTFIVTLIVTAIITFFVTYTCVKRKFSQYTNGKQTVATTNALVYDTVGEPNLKSKGADLELQQNPAYGTSHKMIMDTNPVFESCK